MKQINYKLNNNNFIGKHLIDKKMKNCLILIIKTNMIKAFFKLIPKMENY